MYTVLRQYICMYTSTCTCTFYILDTEYMCIYILEWYTCRINMYTYNTSESLHLSLLGSYSSSDDSSENVMSKRLLVT